MPLPDAWQAVEWDLSGSAALPAGTLGPETVVVHLAAPTGRATAGQMHKAIVGGTRRLTEACRVAGVRHLIHVSSIAAGFTDRRWYPYAEAKRSAEAIALASGVPVTIVRPTMVFGPGSPVQHGLEQLAASPVSIVFGRGRLLVQPVDVDDLASLLLALAKSPPAGGDLVEVGGGDQVPLRDLLIQMRRAAGRRPGRPIPIPLAFPRRILAALESLVGARLPVTAGQFASFANPSVAAAHPLVQQLLPAPRPLTAMLARPAGPTGEGTDSPAHQHAEIAREFEVFAQYLGSTDPGSEAMEAYLRGHPQAVGVREDALDRRLRRLARRSVLGCVLADSYARLARPYGALRRSLVLALAVLESTARHHAAYDSAHAASPGATWAGIVGRGLAWVAWTVTAIGMLAPLHLMDHLREGASGGTDG